MRGLPELRDRPLIAEVKRRNPVTHRALMPPMRRYEEVVESLLRLEPAALSVIVEPEWGGSYEDVERARSVTDLPILAKGRDVNRERAALRGADAVLVFGRPLEDADVVEVANRRELTAAIAHGARTVLVNNRDLSTGRLILPTAASLAPLVPDDMTMIAASGYSDRLEAPERADAVLIGTALMGALSPARW